MNLYSYTYGLKTIIIISAIISLLFIFVLMTHTVLLFFRQGWLILIFFSSTLGMGLSEVAFPFINIIIQFNSIDIDFIKNGLDKGLIQLYITGFLVGIKTIPLFFRVFILMMLRLSRHRRNNDDKLESELFSKFPSLDESKFNSNDLSYLWKLLSQSSIYSISIILLYIALSLQQFNKPSLIVMYFSWVIFLFVDDWMIISAYSINLDTKPLKSHDLRIKIANILLTVGLFLVLWSEVSFRYAIFGTILVLLHCYWVYIFDFNLLQKENDDGG
jgi:hypothetical protein